MTGESAAGAAGGERPPGDGNSAGTDGDAPAASEAFQRLGSETRMWILRTLAAESPLSFSDLFAASGEETSAGFAYHLRQLDGHFVRAREDERYELTDAGRAVVRGARSSRFTASVDRDPIDLAEDCPLCSEASLTAAVSDNTTEVACEACEATVLRLGVPPGGYATRDAEDLPAALDAHHRRRIRSFADGVCPDCAGAVDATTDVVEEWPGEGDARAERDAAASDRERPVPVQASFSCRACGSELECPVSLCVLDHPAVVSFYHDHGEDVRERPIWNVGSEWRERLVSRDPWVVTVRVTLGGEDLLLYVARDLTVVDHRRRNGPDDEGDSRAADRPSAGADSGDEADGETRQRETANAGQSADEPSTDGATA